MLSLTLGLLVILAAAEDLTSLAGAWRQVDAELVLHVDGERLVELRDAQQSVGRLTLEDGWLTRHAFGPQPERRWRVSLDEDGLALTDPGGDTDRFTRLDAVPPRARIDPLTFGDRDPTADERAALVDDLRQRTERDQAVRAHYQEVARELGPTAYDPPQAPALREAIADMHAVDRDNTDWILERVTDVGWIDAARFGSEAHADAFLIVQHSGDLRLMRAALPRIESSLEDDPSSGQSFALLSDRTRLALGDSQLYGSQLWGRAGGGYVVPRLHDPDGVDERRAALGMPPLDDYLDLFRRGGDTVVVEPYDSPAQDA